MTDTTTKHYAEFLYAGSFVSEVYATEIENRDQPIKVPERAYGYRLFSRTASVAGDELLIGDPRDYGPWHYYGTVLTLADVEAMPPHENRILLSNMRGNGWGRVLRCKQGVIPIDDDVVILGERP